MQRQAILWLCGLLIAGGCFETRDPFAPDTGGPEIEWIPPTEPAFALPNIKASIEAKVLDNYANSFAEGELDMLMAEAEIGLLTPPENPFPGWTREDERIRMDNAFQGTTATVALTWDFTSETLKDGEDGERYYEDLIYELKFELGGVESIYSGQVDLYFAEDNLGLWRITRWHDKKNSDNPTWCWLRSEGRIDF